MLAQLERGVLGSAVNRPQVNKVQIHPGFFSKHRCDSFLRRVAVSKGNGRATLSPTQQTVRFLVAGECQRKSLPDY